AVEVAGASVQPESGSNGLRSREPFTSKGPCRKSKSEGIGPVWWQTLTGRGSVNGVSESGVRSGRLLSIVLLLQARGAATAGEIATQLGVSLRTVYRDVQVLGRIGVPIYTETGRAGGYRLLDGYRTSLTGLTAQESLA